MKPAKNTLRDSPAQPLLPCAWRDDRWVDVDTDIDAGAAAAVASVRRGDRFDSTRRIGFPTAATRALPIEKPRPETTILARIPRQIFGALADQRAHQFGLAAPPEAASCPPDSATSASASAPARAPRRAHATTRRADTRRRADRSSDS